MIAAEYGYYGKLPISPEFLRLHAAGPELRWLDEWLQKGMLYAKAAEGPRWPSLVLESDLWNFMYIPAESGRIVCGVLFPSQDKAGRFFPFLSFLLLEAHYLSENPWLVPIIAAEALEGMRNALLDLRKDHSWNDFCRKLNGFESNLSGIDSATETFERCMRTVNATTWWTSLWGSFDDTRKYRLADELKEVIRSLKQPGGPRISSGLSFPLLSQTAASHCCDVAFWLAPCLQPIVRSRQQVPSLICFWSRASLKVPPCALISIGPGSPHLTRFIVSPEAEDDSWHVIGTRSQALTEIEQTIAVEKDEVLDDPDRSLARLLSYFDGSG